mgnify:CR=1 FL=1
MARHPISTVHAPAAIGPYSQAVRSGNTVYLSGQIPLDPATGQMVDGDIAAQTRRVLDNVAALVDASVSDYQRRGFKSLMVSFGCTGGRHRSVYLAEQLAKHLRARKGVDVVVRHIALENTGE